MLIFGDHNCIRFNENMVIFNLSSYIEGFERVDILPSFQVINSGKDFDYLYAQMITTDNYKFTEFMKIIMSLYMGKDVYVIIQKENELQEIVTESLQKYIQQRYGIISNIIYDVSDWEYVVECDFSITGLYNLDIDKNRYNYITVDPDYILKNDLEYLGG